MSDDKIAEIRARHEVATKVATVLNSPTWTRAGWRAHDDRATLLAEIERLREALVLGSEVLASHQGSPQREWHSAGAWLYPGDSINVVRAPLPEIEAGRDPW